MLSYKLCVTNFSLGLMYMHTSPRATKSRLGIRSWRMANDLVYLNQVKISPMYTWLILLNHLEVEKSLYYWLVEQIDLTRLFKCDKAFLMTSSNSHLFEQLTYAFSFHLLLILIVQHPGCKCVENVKLSYFYNQLKWTLWMTLLFDLLYLNILNNQNKKKTK